MSSFADPSPIAVALDAPDLSGAVEIAQQVSTSVSTFKVGLELYMRYGPEAVHAIAAAAPGRKLFLDVKLHDIPNTVGGAARSVAELQPDILTVHAAGGAAMIQAAVEALPNTKIAAVTILTSLSGANLDQLGIIGPPMDAVRRLAALAVGAGATALVCSPAEVAGVRAEVGDQTLLITPGVRPAGADVGDQQRVASPEQAIGDGADLLVIGRPICAAPDRAMAAAQLAVVANSALSIRSPS